MPSASDRSAPASSKRRIVSVDLGELKDEWLAWCERQGVSPSQGLRSVVAKLTAVAPDDPRPGASLRARRGVRDTGRVRRELRLTVSEDAQLARRAAAEGFSPQKWLVALVRAQLTGEPQLGQREQDLLGESNLQLLGVARTLGKLAKLAAAPHGSGAGEGAVPVDAALIHELRQYIERHVERAAGVIEANSERWKIE